MSTAIAPEAVMAYAILTANNEGRPVRIEEVSGLFAKIREKGIQEQVGRVALRRLPHGFYSEDVEAFFGRLLAGGFAVARSPLDINEEGVQLCRELVSEEAETNFDALRKVAEALDLDLSLLTPINAQVPR